MSVMEEGVTNNPEKIELPADLQVPASSPTAGGNLGTLKPPPITPAPQSLMDQPNRPIPPPIVPVVEPLPMRRRGGTSLVGWIIGLLVLGLLGGTVYFVLNYIGFNRGKIEFTFEPAGVDLVIDQKLQKESVNAITITLKAGSHLVQVSKEGYLDWEQTIDLQSRETAQMSVVLEPIPNVELLAEASVTFPSLINKDKFLAFWEPSTGALKAVDLSNQSIIDLFESKFPNLQKVSWSPGGTAAIIKLPNIWRLTNMFDNRRVKGQYIPLGESPEQGPPLSDGVSTWLFDSERRTAAGTQPVLLNESVRDTVFSPDGTQIAYFYTPANGEKSLVRAESIDGSSWTRLLINVDAERPNLQWLNDDRHILLTDDVNRSDRLFDSVSQEMVAIMSDRAPGTLVAGSPEGNKIAYITNSAAGATLVVWDTVEQKAIKVFTKSVHSFVWQDNDTLIVSATDNNLWYWDIQDGRERPVKFASAFGVLQPTQLLYSRLNQMLFIVENSRIFSVKA